MAASNTLRGVGEAKPARDSEGPLKRPSGLALSWYPLQPIRFYVTRRGRTLPSGGGGIRTRGRVAPSPVFKTGAFDRSATPPGRRSLLGCGAQPDGAGDARAPEAAVAVRVLVEVLLVVGLGVEERAGLGDLGRDLAVARRGQQRLVPVARRLDGDLLLVGVVVHRRAILRADVVALTHPGGRVVTLPEGAQDLVAGDLRRVEHDQHRLGVARRSAADLLVGGVRRVAAGVADRRRVHAGELPEQALGAPEAPHADDQRLETVREGRLQRGAEHVVAGRHRHRRLPSGQRAIALDHLRLLTEQEHDDRVCPRPYAPVTRFTLLRWTRNRARAPGEVAEWLKALAC